MTDWLTDRQTKLDLKDPTRGSKKEVNCSFCCLFRYCWVCLLGNNLGIFGFVVILSGRYRGVIIDGAYYVTYLHKRLKYSDDWLWCSNPMFPPRPPLVPQRRISTWKLFRLIRLVLNSLKYIFFCLVFYYPIASHFDACTYTRNELIFGRFCHSRVFEVYHNGG